MKLAEADRKVSLSLQSVAHGLDDAFKEIAGQKMGFCLIVFNADPESRASYVSNCKRDDVIKAMKELLDRWDAGMPDVPAHKIQRTMSTDNKYTCKCNYGIKR